MPRDMESKERASTTSFALVRTRNGKYRKKSSHGGERTTRCSPYAPKRAPSIELVDGGRFRKWAYGRSSNNMKSPESNHHQAHLLCVGPRCPLPTIWKRNAFQPLCSRCPILFYLKLVLHTFDDRRYHVELLTNKWIEWFARRTI